MVDAERVHVEDGTRLEWARRQQAIFSERDMEVGERLSKIETSYEHMATMAKWLFRIIISFMVAIFGWLMREPILNLFKSESSTPPC